MYDARLSVVVCPRFQEQDVPDGVFTRAAKGRAPSCDDVAEIAARVAERMSRWLKRKKLLDERAAEDRSNEAPERSPLVRVFVTQEQNELGDDDAGDTSNAFASAPAYVRQRQREAWPLLSPPAR